MNILSCKNKKIMKFNLILTSASTTKFCVKTMKNVFLIAILTIFSVSTLHSKWLEKEGYWELSEKIPDLRDLKIIPEENLIITVSKDNTIRYIEYDSGKILKSGKPEGLTDTNNYAKISSDGKTTVVARYKKNTFRDSVNVSIFEINSLNKLKDITLSHKYFNFYSQFTSSIFVTYSDFNFDSQVLTFSYYSKIDATHENWYGYCTSGASFIVDFSNIIPLIKNQLLAFAPFAVSKLRFNKQNKYAIISELNENTGFLVHTSTIKKSNSLYFVDHHYDTLNLFKSSFSGEYSYEGNPGSSSKSEYGYLFPMQQVFESNFDSLLYIRGVGRLYTFNINSKRFTDSVDNPLFKSDIEFLKNNKYISQLNNNVYSIYGTINFRKLEDFTLPTDLQNSHTFTDEKNYKTIFALKDGRVISKSFDILNDFSKFGFYWSQDTIYEGNSIRFRALSNITGCKYRWQFITGISTNSNSSDVEYIYIKPGIYGVKLDITKPDGTTLSFKKDSIITVLETVNADFEITKLNYEIPQKVQFTEKSKGAIKIWSWHFGDGESSNEQNPIHEYKFKGDFSPKLIVSDGISYDSLSLYDIIINHNTKIEYSTDFKTKIIGKFNDNYKKCFKTNFGFSLMRTYNKYTGSQFMGYQFFNPILTFKKLNFNFDTLGNNFIVLPSREKYNSSLPFDYELLITDTSIVMFYADNYDFKAAIINLGKIKNDKDELKKHFIVSNIHPINSKNSFYSFLNDKTNFEIIKTDYELNQIGSNILPINNPRQFYSDTLNDNIYIYFVKQNGQSEIFSINEDGNVNYTKELLIHSNIKISGIKVVNNDLILLYGFKIENNVSYGYIAKFTPSASQIAETIVYSRSEINMIQRISNSSFALAGSSRGSQGYLVFDTNVNVVRDIRIYGLSENIKDIYIWSNKVYLFTEKVVSNQTMALGANESYQTTASVLSLPDEIIANVEDSPKIISDKLTHTAYPNPSSDLVNLRVITSETANFSIKLYDIYGNEIIKIHEGSLPAQTEKTFSFPTSQLPIGSNYYVISGVGIIERGKVLVVR